MSSREYRSAAKGESWKFRLMNTIDQCMRYAATKEEFISLMESEGYQVRWTDSRKNITYTTPKGMKCRDDRLHEEKYTKEVMEHEFRIRAALAHGGIEAEERSDSLIPTQTCPSTGGVGQSADAHALYQLTAAVARLWRIWSGTRRPTQPFCGRLPAGGSRAPPRRRWRHWRGMWRKYRRLLRQAGKKERVFCFSAQSARRRCRS